MRTKRAFPLAVALALSACGVDSGLPERLLEWHSEQQDSAVEESVSVDVALNFVSVNGRYVAPQPCVNLKPELDGDNNVVLTVNANSTGAVCPAVLGYFTYGATIGTFKAGNYHLKIQHKDTSGTRVVYDQDFTIR